MQPTFVIAGGGIAGLCTAIALQQIDITCTVVEAAPKLEAVGAGLGLAANAIKALHQIRLADEILPLGSCLDLFTIYDEHKKMITQTDCRANSSRFGVDNFTIHRADLHELLRAKLAPGTLLTNKRIKTFQQDDSKVILHFDDNTSLTSPYVLAADGINSTFRQTLIPGSSPRYAGYTCWRAIVDNSELSLSETMETWGPSGRFGAVPLTHDRVYWFACINAKSPNSEKKHFTTADLLRYFGKYHEPIPQLLRRTDDTQLIWNDIYDLKPIKQYAFNNILLMGDAAHGCTPNLGQGACQAIEDAVLLMSLLKKSDNVPAVFRQFETRRMTRTQEVTRKSALIGKIAQLENPFLYKLRNAIMRRLPRSVHEKRLQKLYDVDLST